VCKLAKEMKVEMPICDMVRQVLEGELTPTQAGQALMSRQLKSEII
jgi:glycerol-3-phosphate dehydrogenase